MKKPIAVLCYLLSVHITALIILSLFRLILYFSNLEKITGVEDRAGLLFRAMLKGLQFDNMIACYVIALPTVVLLVLALFNKVYKPVIKGFNVFFIIVYAIVFAFSAADVPYFSYYFSHMGGSIINWLGFEDTLGMVFQESSYYIYFGFFLLFVVVFSFAVFYIGKKLITAKVVDVASNDYKLYIPLIILIWGFCFIGIRGTLERYPLRVGAAYFCNNSFFNQLGVNPTFFFMKSYSSYKKMKDKLEGIMDIKDAIANVQKELNIEPNEKNSNPISRFVSTTGDEDKMNVVIVLLESMSMEYLKREYEGKTLTPFIHQLMDKSYFFENFYSTGVHTNNGIASTLYGYPAMFERTMMGVDTDLYTGLPISLKDNGYQTLFFLTHNPQYDNMMSFLTENGIENIYSQYDYPKEKVVNNFGVQDDFLFQYGMEKLNDAAKQKEPFLATFMTVSNHPPYVVPEQYKDKYSTDEERIIAFSDKSLQDFMEDASKQEWYDNTIFFILGDHGKIIGEQVYDMSLAYNHIPLIIYSPSFEEMPKRILNFGTQVDIFPTVMGFLNIPYPNNSLGIDLFKEERPYAYFVSDHHLGCVDDNYFYMYHPDTKTEGLYHYRDRSTENLAGKYPAVIDSMRTYSVSMMLTADYLVKNKLVRSPQ
ncbi:MAG: sulfatase-like hydrolase/transferase [Dysgonomonas sp.]|nr:sulfatase-like hydrolase/transferase [Dysgonomonas sp.]